MGLVVFLLAGFYFGRKNPVFYLLIPFALQQGPGAFIDQSISIAGKNLFSVQDTIFNDFLFFVLVCISVFLIKGRLRNITNVGSLLIFVYFLYILLLFTVDYFTYYDSSEVLLTSREFFYTGLNYFLWLSICNALQRKQYEDFLQVMFYITPVSALLYVLNSSGILSVFPKELMYSEVEFDTTGSTIRDFATIPLFLSTVLVLAIQTLLMPTLRIPKYLLAINLAVLPVALLFTYTRSLILGIVMHVFFIVVLNCMQKGAKSIRKAVIFFVLSGISLGPVYIAAAKMFPNQMEYLISRFTDASKEGRKEQNVDIRIAYLTKAIEITNYSSPAFGAGLNRSHYQEMNAIGAWKADSTIPFLLYHTGWIGVALIYIILIYFSVDSTLLFLKSGDWFLAFLASGFISLSISTLITGGGALYGSVWTFMNFALYITIKYNLWKKVIIMVPANWVKAYLNYSAQLK